MRATTWAWAAACAWGVACAGAERPPHWVVEMQRGWASKLNSGQYGAAAWTLMAEGVVVPEGAAKIIRRVDMQAYFTSQPARQRLLAPRASQSAERRGVLHTVGTNLVDNTTYYVRMAGAATVGRWQFETVVFASKVATPTESEAAVPAWLAGKLHDLRALLERGAFDDAVAAHFAADAVLVDDVVASGPVLVPHTGIAAVLPKLIPSSAAAGPHVQRVIAFETTAGGAVHHVVAEQMSTLTGRVRRCYMRWVGAGVAARVAVFMASIGEGCEGPSCHGGVAVGASHEIPIPAWLLAAERRYSAAFTTGDVGDAADHHAADGVIVPHTAARLVRGDITAATVYLRTLHNAAPAMDLRARAVLLRPSQQLLGSGAAVHVVGENRANGGAYYMRWTAHRDAPTWRVGTAVFGCGGGSSHYGAAALAPAVPRGDGPPPAWMGARLAAMESFYNDGATHDLVRVIFSNDAVLVGGAANGTGCALIEGSGRIAAAVDGMRAGWADLLALQVVDAVFERDGVWSMIGEAAPTKPALRGAAAAAAARRFYVRWVYSEVQEAWLADVVVARVGAPAAWPVRNPTNAGY